MITSARKRVNHEAFRLYWMVLRVKKSVAAKPCRGFNFNMAIAFYAQQYTVYHMSTYRDDGKYADQKPGNRFGALFYDMKN